MRSVLLVDDTPPLRTLVRKFLHRTGRYEVVAEVGDGEQGVATAAEVTPDIILLDLSMPVMDGLTALPLLREAAPDSKIVVFTGVEHRHLLSEIMSRGAVACVAKGAPLPELVELLDSVCVPAPHVPGRTGVPVGPLAQAAR